MNEIFIVNLLDQSHQVAISFVEHSGESVPTLEIGNNENAPIKQRIIHPPVLPHINSKSISNLRILTSYQLNFPSDKLLDDLTNQILF